MEHRFVAGWSSLKVKRRAFLLLANLLVTVAFSTGGVMQVGTRWY